ncbi:MAG: ATP-binding cassette domain-containing protein [Butyrivibrio sp.]
MEYILTTDNLTKQYKKVRAVDGINLHVKKGDIYGFIGRNGAGKTTTLKMISGLAHPTGGSFTLFGKSLEQVRKENLFSKVGILIEEPGLYTDMSALKNVKIKCMAAGLDKPGYAESLLEMVGLGNTGKRATRYFSMGMKQRLGIAMALVGDPQLLILDEPINGLDPQGICEVRETILKLNKEQGKTIILSSHILEELSKISTTYGIINNGKLVDELPADELASKCQARIVIHVQNNMEGAVEVIKSMGITKFNVSDGNTINIMERLDETAQIGMALAKADIFISSIGVEQADLESFYFNMTGGAGNGQHN